MKVNACALEEASLEEITAFVTGRQRRHGLYASLGLATDEELSVGRYAVV